MEQNKPWHTLTRDAAYELLSSSPNGLTSAEASKRLVKTGPNEIQAAKRMYRPGRFYWSSSRIFSF